MISEEPQSRENPGAGEDSNMGSYAEANNDDTPAKRCCVCRSTIIGIPVQIYTRKQGWLTFCRGCGDGKGFMALVHLYNKSRRV